MKKSKLEIIVELMVLLVGLPILWFADCVVSVLITTEDYCQELKETYHDIICKRVKKSPV